MADDKGGLHVLKQKPADGDYRLFLIRSEIDRLLVDTDLVVMEDLPRNAMAAGVTGMVQGVIREYLVAWAIPYLLVSPATLKKFATGKGNAKKPDMRRAWFDHTGQDVADDNKVDAAWLREIGLYLSGERKHELSPRHWWGAVENLLPQWEGVSSRCRSSVSA